MKDSLLLFIEDLKFILKTKKYRNFFSLFMDIITSGAGLISEELYREAEKNEKKFIK